MYQFEQRILIETVPKRFIDEMFEKGPPDGTYEWSSKLEENRRDL